MAKVYGEQYLSCLPNIEKQIVWFYELQSLDSALWFLQSQYQNADLKTPTFVSLIPALLMVGFFTTHVKLLFFLWNFIFHVQQLAF